MQLKFSESLHLSEEVCSLSEETPLFVTKPWQEQKSHKWTCVYLGFLKENFHFHSFVLVYFHF